MSDLSFDKLRRANVARCGASYHPINDWTLSDWACAAAGEMGETCDVVKKMRRLEIKSGFVRDNDGPDYEAQLADEIADTVIYLDLLAKRAGIDLGEAIRSKFNVVSDRVGSGVKL